MGVLDSLDDDAGGETVDGNDDGAVILQGLGLGTDHLEVVDLVRETGHPGEQGRLGGHGREGRGVHDGVDVALAGGAGDGRDPAARGRAVAVQGVAVEDEHLEGVHLRLGALAVGDDTGGAGAGTDGLDDETDGKGLPGVCHGAVLAAGRERGERERGCKENGNLLHFNG